MKITHRLALGGWLETVRGRGGGMRLAMPAQRINLGSVVRGVEPDFALVECFAGGSSCTLTGDCGLAAVIRAGLRSFMQQLDAHTLADVLPRPGGRAGPGVAPLRFRPGAANRVGDKAG